MNAEHLAQLFHERYEMLAPEYSYETRKASAVPWSEVPAQHKNLMIAVARDVLAAFQAEEQPVRIWATSTDLEGTNQERKRYFMLLEDTGKPDLRFVLHRHAPDDAIAVEPYKPDDFDYTDYDPDWDDDEDDYYNDCEVSDDDEEEDESADAARAEDA